MNGLIMSLELGFELEIQLYYTATYDVVCLAVLEKTDDS